MKRLAFILVVSAVSIVSCAPRYPLGDEPAPFAFARAHLIEHRAECLSGPAAQGEPGDILMENDRIRVVIDHPLRPHAFAVTGGHILDAAPRGGKDHLEQVFAFIDDRFRGQAEYRELSITAPGGVGGKAAVVVTGVVGGMDGLSVTTTYELSPSALSLRLSTTLKNETGDTLADLALRDAVEWGQGRRFIPGRGFERGTGWSEGPWIASVAEDCTYGWAVARGRLEGPHGWGWSDVGRTRVTLGPGDEVSYDRYLVTVYDGVSSVSGEALRLRGSPVGRLETLVRETGTHEPVGGARVTVFTPQGGSLLEGRSAGSGDFACLLPPGEYELAVRAPGRAASNRERFRLAAGEIVDWKVELPPPSFVEFRVREKKRSSGETPGLPARLVFFAVPPTPEPEFTSGGGLVADGRAIFAPTGNGRVPLVPGEYEVWVTHGPEFDAATGHVVVGVGQTVGLEIELAQVVWGVGAVAADLGLHTSGSHDCAVDPADRIVELVTNGVEVVAVTDDRTATDLDPLIEELGYGENLRAFRGTEVRSREVGGFTLFPLVVDPHGGDPGEWIPTSGRAEELLSLFREWPRDPLLVVTEPVAATFGYFWIYDLLTRPRIAHRPGFSWDFDAVEILRGGELQTAERLLRTWEDLLNVGYRFTALGSSGSRLLVSPEAGYPRSYLLAGVDRPREFTADDLKDTVRRHRVVVTNGPFLRLGINGRGVGDSVVVAPGESLRVELAVEAAPWVKVARLELRENGRAISAFDLPESPPGDVMHFRRRLTLLPPRDSWYTVVALGGRFTVPAAGRATGGEGWPFAFTNPIWVDADGDGNWRPPR